MNGAHQHLRLLWAGPLLAALASGCGLSVDADRFRQVAPALGSQDNLLYEGAGGPASVGKGVPLWIPGAGFTEAATVRAEDARVTLSTVKQGAAQDGLSVLAWVAPFLDLGEGEQQAVTLWVEEGTTTASVSLTIEGLPELTLAGTVDPLTLRPLYSGIRTEAPVRFEGVGPARLSSVGAIDLGHPVSVSALGAVPGAGGRAPGQGARAGGQAEDVSSGCASGGGGAGARLAGQPSDQGTQGGAPASLMPGLLPLDDTPGHGGGHGGASDADAGRPGGAGAGAILVDGAVVQWRAEVQAQGGDGEAADGNGCGQSGAGAGGGGAGGMIWVRARQALVGSAAAVIAGGRGGAGGQKAGGDGADGWLRIDAPEALDAVGLGIEDARYPAYRGPAWAVPDARLAPAAAVEFVADPELSLAYLVDDVQVGQVQTRAEGRGEVAAPSAPGLHQLCLALASNPSSPPQEVRTCLRVAILP